MSRRTFRNHTLSSRFTLNSLRGNAIVDDDVAGTEGDSRRIDSAGAWRYCLLNCGILFHFGAEATYFLPQFCVLPAALKSFNILVNGTFSLPNASM